MTATAFLMGLLALSFFGSVLVGRKGSGLASGIEFVGLGVLAGPLVLGWISRSTIDSFAPVIHVALGWLAFVIGLDFGRFGSRRTTRKVMAASTVAAAFTLASVAAATWFALRKVGIPFAQPRDAMIVSLAFGVVATETTRHAVKWVLARFSAHGPLTDRFAQMASSDDLVPLLVLGVVALLLPGRVHVAGIPDWTFALATVLIGAFFAAIAALLLKEAEGDEVWAVLLGTVLLTVGIALRLGLATLTAGFIFGITLRALSSHRRAIRVLVAPTERPVLLPMLLVAGARIDVAPLFVRPKILWVVGAAILARVVAKVVVGFFVREGGRSHPSFGAGLLSSGALSLACGLFVALRAPGIVGDSVLLFAALVALVGEILAPFAARHALDRAGEIDAAVPEDNLADTSDAKESA